MRGVQDATKGIYNVSKLWEPEKAPKVYTGQVTLSRGRFCRRCLRQQLANAIGQLGSIAGPVVDAVALQINRRRVGARIVRSYNFDRTAIAGAVLFDNHNTIVRLLTRSNARQTDHQHWECLSELVFVGGMTAPFRLSGQ